MNINLKQDEATNYTDTIISLKQEKQIFSNDKEVIQNKLDSDTMGSMGRFIKQGESWPEVMSIPTN
jgi:hypothetical protein